ncbi:MAG: Gfo/Idh/MocA family oxidoreductase [Pseudomonadota bacterium]
MTASIKVAIAGTGYFSQFHFDAWMRCPEMEIVAVASLDASAAEQAAKPHGAKVFVSAREMIETVDADLVDIVTPPPTHRDLIEACAARGVMSICQKPFCGTLDAAHDAVKVLQAAEATCVVHENFRFQPWYQAVKAVLDDGRLGTIYQALFRLRPGDGQGADAYLERQPYFQTMERFVVHETGVHYIDVFRYLFGPLETIWADLRKLNPVIAGEDDGLLVLGHDNGLRTLIDANRLADHAATNTRRTMGELIIDGEKGELRLDGEAQLTFRARGSSDWQTIDYRWNDHGFGGDCVYNFTRHVVDHLVDGTPLANTAADYLANLEAEEAAYRSAKTGCVQKLA